MDLNLLREKSEAIIEAILTFLKEPSIWGVPYLRWILCGLFVILFISSIGRILRLIRLYALVAFTSRARITYVKSNVDGDTIKVVDRFKKTQSAAIRMIGMDTPESLKSMYMEVAPFGKEAANYTMKRLKKGQKLILVYGKLPYDKFGRELVYVYLPFGEFYNETLVRKGYAFAKEYPPNTKYSKRFKRLEDRAKRKELNMWMVYQDHGVLRKDYKKSSKYRKFKQENPDSNL